eukprot:symbB.v1.2.008316.t1/scaffold499.1/size195312/22
MEAVNLDTVIQQVCRTLKQWSIEGPPRNPRKAAGDLATLLEADAADGFQWHACELMACRMRVNQAPLRTALKPTRRFQRQLDLW